MKKHEATVMQLNATFSTASLCILLTDMAAVLAGADWVMTVHLMCGHHRAQLDA